jgi:hypothetical protein
MISLRILLLRFLGIFGKSRSERELAALQAHIE